MKTVVQISLDITNIPEALETAHLAIRSGVDWLEAGTPLIIAEGMHGVRALRKEFPGIPIRTPEYGAPLVVLGAPLTIDANSFKTAQGDLESQLRLICEKVHAYGNLPAGQGSQKRE